MAKSITVCDVSEIVAESQPYTLSRSILARFSAEQYVRNLWFVIAGVPVFGLFAVFMPGTELTQTIGWFCLGWPLTIPLRGYLVTAKMASRFSRPTKVVLTGEDLLVASEGSVKGLRLSRNQIRSVSERYGYVVVTSRRLAFLLVPSSALLKDAKSQILKAADLTGTDGVVR